MIIKVIALLIAGTLVGFAFGSPFAGLAVAAVVLLGRHLFMLNKLAGQLTVDSIETLRTAPGSWERVFGGIKTLKDDAQRANKLNRRLTQQWRTITDALPDAGILLDESHNIVQFNETARVMLRIEGATDIGRRISRVIRNPAFVEALGSDRLNEPIRFTNTREPERTLAGQLTAVGDKQYILLVRDITEQLRTEKVKTDFVANASHELRTPITVLKGYLQELSEDDSLSEAWQEPVEEMNQHIDRMESLVNDLLRLNRFEAEVDAPLEAVDIRKIIKRACKEARLLSEDGAQIRFEIDSDLTLLGAKTALRSVVSNLLTNAVRFTPTDGEIVVRWCTDEQGGFLSVSDTGIGIDSDEIERVTERFYRTDPGRARHLGGTGLGLAIVKHALAMHGGQLSIESEPDQGSVFTCHFPLERLVEKE